MYGGLRLDPSEGSSEPLTEYVNLQEGVYKAGQLLGELTASPGTFAPYNPLNNDGSEEPLVILKYSVTIDTDGRAVKSNVEDNWIVPQNVVALPAYVTGVFDIDDLVDLDQYAIDTLGRSIGSGRLMLEGIDHEEFVA
jgi:hypothetical protein